MPIHASLGRLHIQTPDPEGMAAFYARAYGMVVTVLPGMLLCAGPQRRVSFALGTASQLHYALFHFTLAEDFVRFAAALPEQVLVDVSAYPELPERALALRDPDGTLLVFIRVLAVQHEPAGPLAEAATQHFALRTTQIETILDFYTGVAGFTLSDSVEDGDGKLRAAPMSNITRWRCSRRRRLGLIINRWRRPAGTISRIGPIMSRKSAFRSPGGWEDMAPGMMCSLWSVTQTGIWLKFPLSWKSAPRTAQPGFGRTNNAR